LCFQRFARSCILKPDNVVEFKVYLRISCAFHHLVPANVNVLQDIVGQPEAWDVIRDVFIDPLEMPENYVDGAATPNGASFHSGFECAFHLALIRVLVRLAAFGPTWQRQDHDCQGHRASHRFVLIPIASLGSRTHRLCRRCAVQFGLGFVGGPSARRAGKQAQGCIRLRGEAEELCHLH
jgi:hypothetical protein